jgi:hypothetical protein
MPQPGFQRSLMIGSIPFAAVVVSAVVMNLTPSCHESLDLDDPFFHSYKSESYGFPDAFCTYTTEVENRFAIWGDGATLRNPHRGLPRWATKRDFDSDVIVWNVYWIGLAALLVCFLSTVAHLIWTGLKGSR